MTHRVGAELLALRTTRSTLRFVAGAWALAIFLVISYLGVRDLGDTRAADAVTAITSASVCALALMLLAAASMSGEVRHGTLPGVLVVAPERTRFVMAKALAAAVLAAAAGAVAALLATLYVLVALGASGGELPAAVDIAVATARSMLYCALMGLLGVGFGALLESQTAAVAVPLVLLLVVDPLLAAVSEAVARWGAGGAAAALLGGDGSDLLPAWAGALLLAAYAGAVLAAGAAVLTRRDVR